MTSHQKGSSPWREAPPTPASVPSASGPLSVQGREVALEGEGGKQREVTASQAPPPGSALPAQLQARGHLADFQKKIKYMTGGEPVATDGFWGCPCAVVAEDPPRMQRMGEATPSPPISAHLWPRLGWEPKSHVGIPRSKNPRKSLLKKQPAC